MHDYFDFVLKIVVSCQLISLVKAYGVIGPHVIQNEANCMCLDIKDGNYDVGTIVITDDCSRKQSQLWDIHNVGNGYLIVNHYSGLVLDVEHGSKTPGASVIQWVQNGACNQRWIFDRDGVIRNGHSNLVLDVCKAKPGRISSVIAYTRHAKLNQLFRVIPVGNIRPYQI